MSDDSPNPRDLFLAAIQLPPDQWESYVHKSCAGNTALQQRLLELLAAHRDAGSILAPDEAAQSPTVLQEAPWEGPGQQIGPYKLLEQIGEGGFGIVYLADQTAPVRRRVALKVLKPGMDTRQVVARFEAERQALALMDHPNIATVFDGGTTPGGRPYFVMELVKGSPITEFCDANRLAPRERLELFVTVCQAVQHAHQKGIIHRDLKPSNVLVTVHDTVPVVKIIDFGVAKALGQELTEKTLFTGFAHMIGTPLYMSPEQAGQSGLDVDTRSDVYSLGVLLYELLTGTTPFSKDRLRQAAYDEIRRIIQDEEPPRPSARLSELSQTDPSGGATGTRPASGRDDRATSLASVSAVRKTDPHRLSRLVRGELDWIVMKALEKDRTRRYPTALGLAVDVQRFLAAEPVEACPPSMTYRVRKFAWRHKGAFSAGLSVAAALLIAVVGLAMSNLRVTAERDEKILALAEKDAALREKGQALSEKEQALQTAKESYAEARRHESLANEQAALSRRRFYAAQMNLAMQAWLGGEPPRVLQLLESQRPGPDDDDLRGFEWFYLWRQCHGGRRQYLRDHRGAVSSLAFSPDGAVLASASFDRSLKLWDPQTGQLSRTLGGYPNHLWTVVFSPDGQTFASGGKEQGPLIIWETKTGRPRHVLDEMVEGLSFSPDGATLAGGGATTRFWDVATGRLLRAAPESGLLAGFLADGQTVATLADRYLPTSELRLWDAQTGELRRTFPLAIAQNVVLSPDRTHAALSNPSSVTIMITASAERRITIPLDSGVMAFSPDGETIACSSGAKSVVLFEAATGRLLGRDAHLEPIGAIAFSPDGKRLASSTMTGEIRLWDMAGPQEPNIISAKAGVRAIRFSADSQELLVADAAEMKAVVVQTLAEVRRVNSDRVVAISADRGTILEKQADCWLALDAHDRSETGRIPRSRPGEPPDRHDRASLSADGSLLATYQSWENDNTVNLWNLQSGRLSVFRPPSPESNQLSVLCAQFSPDGRYLAAGYQFQWFTVWEVATGEVRLALSQPPDLMCCYSIAFSPDSSKIAVGTDGGAVTLWEIDTGRRLAAMRGHMRAVDCLAISSDGSTLASGGGDYTVKLWDTATGQERFTLAGHTGVVEQIAFSPDSSVLATASRDGNVRLWRGATEAEAVRRRGASALDDPFEPIANQYARFAWQISTSPNPAERDPPRAVELAAKGVDLKPQGEYQWLALALARYRAADWSGAITALDRLQALDEKAYRHSTSFLRAMAHWQLGERDKAGDCYARGARWMSDQAPLDPLMYRLQTEAAALLGLPAPAGAPLLPGPSN